MKDKDYRGFYEDLKETMDNYQGTHSDLIKYCPKFFKLLCDILNDKRADWNTRLLVNSALAYFVLPDDIIPDYEYDGRGYLDDLFITAYVLLEIKNNIDESLLTENWNEEEEILKLVESIHDKCKILIGDSYLDVLRLVGLKKYVSLGFNKHSDDFSKRLAKLNEEKRELLGLLSFVVSKLYGAPRFRDIENLRNYLKEHDDYDELERILFVAKQKKYDSPEKIENHATNINQQELRDKKIERLMKGRTNDV